MEQTPIVLLTLNAVLFLGLALDHFALWRRSGSLTLRRAHAVYVALCVIMLISNTIFVVR